MNQRERDRCVDVLCKRVLSRDSDFPYLTGDLNGAAGSSGLVDYLFSVDGQEIPPDDVFNRLRWGGQLVFVSRSARTVSSHAREYHGRRGFIIEYGPASVRTGPMGFLLPFLGRPVHYFIARKVTLIQPGQTTERFTFDVQLIRRKGADHGLAVLKQVPSYSSIAGRLMKRFPNTSLDLLAERARKLVDKVFPIFLTREAGFLNLLQQVLPETYRHRVPRVLDIEKDSAGMVRKLCINWLRVGGRPISQLEFAKQSADLLDKLHNVAGIIHLDLRMDNIVITRHGVGFVDFGSAVRIGEDLSKTPMLQSLFDEMMSTSQIQRLLGRMKSTGRVTSKMLIDGHQKIDKAADLFYLAMQINKPHTNPDLQNLIHFDPGSEEARRISLLTESVLRPMDPQRPSFVSAKDILNALNRIEAKIVSRSPIPGMGLGKKLKRKLTVEATEGDFDA